jgi:hypothetical protein
MAFRIRNWSEFQHYGDKRMPPWIKLHRMLLNNREWHALSGDASKLLVECWLVASETNDGAIPLTLPDLAWRLRRSECEMRAMMKELVTQRFIEICGNDASAPLAGCEQDACLDVREEKREEVEEDVEKKKTLAQPAAPAEPVDRFEEFWAERPRREGSDPKKEAHRHWNARIREGVEAQAIIDSVVRYREWCKAKKKIGTETVMRAATFLGDPEHFANPWAVPKAVTTGGGDYLPSPPTQRITAEGEQLVAGLMERVG